MVNLTINKWGVNGHKVLLGRHDLSLSRSTCRRRNLAAKLSVKGASAMLERLESAGCLAEQGDEHVLTERAIAALRTARA
jgi:Mn-dependent DtxR family transcriptional regulator